MNVAFCINRLALIGLGVTISSLIRNCTDTSQVTLWFLCAGLHKEDKENILSLLEADEFRGVSRLIDFNPIEQFGKFRSLHGDWTPYGRLLLSDLLKESTVLYLDADLVVNLDILKLKDFDLSKFPIAAVKGATVRYALEKDFLVNDINLSLDDAYFNSGVLLMNLDQWRSGNIKASCLKLATQYSDKLLAVDQTILNALFSRSFAELPAECNSHWVANAEKPAIGPKEAILHYVGSPKPWDIGARYIHKGYSTWRNYLNDEWSKQYMLVGFLDLARAWKIRRSYFRVFSKLMKG